METVQKTLILVRGVSGSGKSTFAKQISESYLEADQYFIDENGNYNFDANKLPLAHKWCQLRTEHMMEDNQPRIIVSNTFTREWEMQPYFDLAKKYGYMTFTVIVENRHNGQNVHGVPEIQIEKMKNRFEIVL